MRKRIGVLLLCICMLGNTACNAKCVTETGTYEDGMEEKEGALARESKTEEVNSPEISPEKEEERDWEENGVVEGKKLETTKEPIVTEVPVYTQAPQETVQPVKTQVPAKTEAPVYTQIPSETKPPAKTTEPAATTVPTRAPEPAKTSEPKATPEPQETRKPVATQPPENTGAPEENTKPQESTETKEHTHEFEKSVWELPTCQKGGYYNLVCKLCGHVECVTQEPLAHEVEDIVIQEGNCMEDTIIRHICKLCETQVKSDTRYTVYDKHDWNKVVLEEGEAEECSRCGVVR